MVDGARLESVCTGNRTVGSNPTFTASILLSRQAGGRIDVEPRQASQIDKDGTRPVRAGCEGRRFLLRRIML